MPGKFNLGRKSFPASGGRNGADLLSWSSEKESSLLAVTIGWGIKKRKGAAGSGKREMNRGSRDGKSEAYHVAHCERGGRSRDSGHFKRYMRGGGKKKRGGEST